MTGHEKASTILLRITEGDLYGNRDLGSLSGIAESISGLIKNTSSAILYAVVPLTALIMLYNLVIMMTCSDQRKVDSSRAWLVRAAIVLVVIIALPYIISFVRDIGKALSR